MKNLKKLNIFNCLVIFFISVIRDGLFCSSSRRANKIVLQSMLAVFFSGFSLSSYAALDATVSYNGPRLQIMVNQPYSFQFNETYTSTSVCITMKNVYSTTPSGAVGSGTGSYTSNNATNPSGTPIYIGSWQADYPGVFAQATDENFCFHMTGSFNTGDILTLPAGLITQDTPGNYSGSDVVNPGPYVAYIGNSTFTGIAATEYIAAPLLEDFESETLGSLTFTDAGQSFTITPISSDPYDIGESVGDGWNGTAVDNRFIDNTGLSLTALNDGSSFSVKTTNGADITIKSLYLWLSTTSLDLSHTGALTIIGNKDNALVYTITKTSGFETSLANNNGFTYINFTTEGGVDNSNDPVDELIFTTTNNADYLALDAFEWAVAPPSSNAAPTDITLSSTSINQAATSAGADVGTLSTTDSDDTVFTYSLVANGASANGSCGTGNDANNASFQTNSAILETSTALSAAAYKVCVQTNDGDTTFQKAFTVTVLDTVPPAVSSITLVGTPAANVASVQFTVTFNENANNISTDDFALSNLGSGASGTISTVSASSGTSVTVTVNSISGPGTLRLVLNSSTNIVDDAGNGNGTNGSVATFTSGSTHTVTLPTFTALADLCVNAGAQTGLGGGSPTGGIYSGPGTTDSGNGSNYSFSPAAAGVGVHNLTYTNGLSNTDAVEVFALPSVSFTALADLPIDAGTQTGLGGGTPTGGVYSGPGVADDGNGMTYSFNPAAAGLGLHIVSYTFVNANGCGASATDAVQVLAEITPPVVQSIAVVGTPAANAASMQFTVTFDELANNISPDDFTVSAVALGASGTVSAVSATSGTSVIVTVNTIAGTGSFRLNLDASTNITDSQGNGNNINGYVAAFATGAVHTVDRVGPVVSSVTVPSNSTYVAGQNLDFIVNFNENVTVIAGATVPALLLTLGSTPSSATYVSGDGTGSLLFRYTVQTGDEDTNGISVSSPISPNTSTLRDAAGNNINTTLNSVGSLTNVLVDAIAPTLTISAPSAASAIASGSVSYTVTYSGANSISLLSTNVTLNSPGTASASIAVTGTGSTTRTITLSNFTGQGNLGISLAASTASDAAGNTALAAGPSGVISVDAIAPRLQSITRLTPTVATTAADSVTLRYTFNENVSSVANSNFTSNNASVISSINVTGSNSIYDVVFTGPALAEHDGTINFGLNVTGITDIPGNAMTNAAVLATNNNSYTFDNTAPTIAISAPSLSAATGSSTVTYTLTYSGADAVTLVAGNVQLNTTGGVTGNVSVSGSGTTARTVTLYNFTENGTMGITIASGTANDTLGNTAVASSASSTFIVDANAAGSVNITGLPVVNSVLTAVVVDGDGIPGAITYQWMSNGGNVGTNQNTYTVQSSDDGQTISVNVQYVDGDPNNENLTSSPTSTVASVEQNALNVISATANNAGSTPPTVTDYSDAGVTDVTTGILALVNIAVANQSAAGDVDSAAELQPLVATILLAQDDDNDGIPNLVEGTIDTDRDGLSDDKDSDSDNDGISDALEMLLTLDDTDNDGIIDELDADNGNDGTVDVGKLDANFDGLDDNFDSAAKFVTDNSLRNADGDARLNYVDGDSDNDGLYDVSEAVLPDLNLDAQIDAGDTLIADKSLLADTDNNNIPNFLSVQSDALSNDFLSSSLPANFDANNDGVLDSTADIDGDGLMDVIDNAVGAFGSIPDFDGDGIPNHLDEDDDNDGIPDSEENNQEANMTGLDADADGIDDGIDAEVNGVVNGPDTNNNGVIDSNEFSDLDGDGLADHFDNDSDNDNVVDLQDASINVGEDVGTSSGVGAAGFASLYLMLSLLLLRMMGLRRRLSFFFLSAAQSSQSQLSLDP